ncbi:MAG: hypothetical protein HY320_01900 [Armatimonadetes bacterium]|nr:hypothetical protein [Armatimonadota bacterium]
MRRTWKWLCGISGAGLAAACLLRAAPEIARWNGVMAGSAGAATYAPVGPGLDESLAEVTAEAGPASSPLAAFQVSEVPADPFRPLPLDGTPNVPGGAPEVPALASAGSAVGSERSAVPNAFGTPRQEDHPVPAPFVAPLSAAAAEVVPPPVAPEPPRLRGVIGGQPAVALVHWREHTYFLKVGERIADAWELEQVNDGSAVFRHGERRVEVQIEGGSSR